MAHLARTFAENFKKMNTLKIKFTAVCIGWTMGGVIDLRIKASAGSAISIHWGDTRSTYHRFHNETEMRFDHYYLPRLIDRALYHVEICSNSPKCRIIGFHLRPCVDNFSDKVFISGSISIKSLTKYNMMFLEHFLEDNPTILIGDAFGVDKAVQQILADRNYRSVIVYFSGEKVRNNIGDWQTKQIPNPENLTGRSRYQLKDKAMADDCDCGLMFWDGKSMGTQHNMACLERLGKMYLLITIE